MNKKKVFRIAMVLIGALGGYLYYAYIGCVSGTCGMASNGFFMTIYGATLGYLIGGIFTPVKKKQEEVSGL